MVTAERIGEIDKQCHFRYSPEGQQFHTASDNIMTKSVAGAAEKTDTHASLWERIRPGRRAIKLGHQIHDSLEKPFTRTLRNARSRFYSCNFERTVLRPRSVNYSGLRYRTAPCRFWTQQRTEGFYLLPSLTASSKC